MKERPALPLGFLFERYRPAPESGAVPRPRGQAMPRRKGKFRVFDVSIFPKTTGIHSFTSANTARLPRTAYQKASASAARKPANGDRWRTVSKLIACNVLAESAIIRRYQTSTRAERYAQILFNADCIFLFGTGDIGIVKAQNKAAALLFGKHPVQQRRSCVADVNAAGGRGCKTDNMGGFIQRWCPE